MPSRSAVLSATFVPVLAGALVVGALDDPVLDRAEYALAEPRAPDRYRAVVELEIGELDGPRALTYVAGLVPADERIYVAQEPENVIRVFSIEGELLEEWGGKGGGPGEFQRFDWMGAIDDAVWVVDLPQGRLTAFDLEGRVQETRPTPQIEAPPPLAFVGPAFPTVEGGVVIFGVAYGPGTDPLPRSPGLLVGPDDRVLDSVPPIRWGDRRIIIESDGGRASFPRPMYAGARFAMAPAGDAFVVADSEGAGGLTLRRYDVRARRTDVFRLGWPDLEVPRAFADSVETAAVELWSGRLHRLDRRTIAEAIEVPDRVPAADAILVAADGAVWLRMPNFGPGPDVWRVVGLDGELEREVEVPKGIDLHALVDGRLWGVREDEYSVSYIQRMRLEPAGG